MHIQPPLIKRAQSLQIESTKEIQNREFSVKGASTDKPRETLGVKFMHRIHDTGDQLDPTAYLDPTHCPLMLTELNRPMRSLDQRQEINRKAAIQPAPTIRTKPHQLPPRPTILNPAYRIPRILSAEKRRGRLSRFVPDAMSRMEAIELMLKQRREHAEMFERLQREAAFPIADMDTEATGRVDLEPKLFLQHANEPFHPLQRFRTEAQWRRRDLDVALEVSIHATTVLDHDGHIGRDGPLLVRFAGAVIVGPEAVGPEDLDDFVAADDSEFVVVGQAQRVLFLPQEAFGERYPVFELVGTEDDDAFDFDAEGKMEGIGHVWYILAEGMCDDLGRLGFIQKGKRK